MKGFLYPLVFVGFGTILVQEGDGRATKTKGMKTDTDLASKDKLVLQNGRELVSVVVVEGKEFFVDPKYENILSFYEAVKYCNSFNMTIGETLTAHQYQQVYLHIPLFYNCWLGGTDEGSDNSWYWITSRAPFSYSRWGFTQPSISPVKNCMYFIEELQIWWTNECGRSVEPEDIHVLCERPVM